MTHEPIYIYYFARLYFITTMYNDFCNHNGNKKNAVMVIIMIMTMKMSHIMITIMVMTILI